MAEISKQIFLKNSREKGPNIPFGKLFDPDGHLTPEAAAYIVDNDAQLTVEQNNMVKTHTENCPQCQDDIRLAKSIRDE